jgi:hypothetical protein
MKRIKIQWLIPLLTALALFRPSNGLAWEYTNNFSWLELIPPGYWLDSWSFEDGSNWDSDFGFAPMSYSNIVQVPDWDGNALQVDSTNAAWLTYAITENAPGYGEYTNLTIETGSIEFMFVPNWQSADTNYFGNGPGDWGRFIDIGTWDTNADRDWWSLYLNPSGTGIYFSSGTNGVRTNYLNVPISWDGSTWHQIVLTFGPTNSFLYLDGQLAASGKGVCYLPSGDVLTNGFAIGSDFATGLQQAHGIFDDLYTYNYQLSANDVASDYADISPELPGGFHAMDDSPPFPGEGGSDGGASPADDFSYSPNYGTNLWIQQFGIISNNFTGILSNTIPGVSYQLLYANSLNPPVQWISDGFIPGSFSTNWTPWSLPYNPTTNFFLSALSWQVDSGTGIPDWWLQKYFGEYTNIDAYADPIGDGYTIYQDYVNGWSPSAWEQPPAPQGLTVDSFNSANNTATLSWLPSPGAVTGYTLETYDAGNINLPANATNYVDNESGLYDGYELQANYSNGPSALSDLVFILGNPIAGGAIVQGPQGNLYLVLSKLPPDITEIEVNRYSWDSGGYLTAVFPNSGAYGYAGNFPNDPLTDGSFEIPLASFTNGICEIPTSDVTPFFPYQFQVLAINSNGVPNGVLLNGMSDFYNATALAEVPFIDQRRHMKDNLQFLLRAADDVGSFTFNGFAWPTNHVCAGFYGSGNGVRSYPDPVEPLEDNLFYKNFVFDSDNLTNEYGSAYVNTGYFYTDYSYPDSVLAFNYDTTGNPFVEYFFNLAEFVTDPVVPASVLSASETTFLVPPTYEGIDNFETNFPAGGDQNIYGLPFLAAEDAWYTNNAFYAQTFYPGQSSFNGATYYDVKQPNLQITNYYFCEPGIDEMPEETNFASTNTTPLIIVPVGGEPQYYQNYFGAPIQLAAYARMSVGYANSGVYAYLGQFFTNAYQIDDNGNVTTNSPGFLSPYGQFFATEPGPAAIITMPDIDTGQQGTDIVYCVSMNVDKNHDGTIDTSYTGADATSLDSPMEFWVNGGSDQPNANGGEDKMVPPASPNYTVGQITCPRDLENFGRLWICGMPALPTNGTYQVTLSWQNPYGTGSPAINLYTSVETNGGIGYLTDTNIAATQCALFDDPDDNSFGPGVALATNISQDSSYTFPANYFANGGNQYFLFEGAGIGEGELTLSIYRNGNLIAQTGVWLDLHNIQDFYEVAEATNVTSGLPPSTLVSQLHVVRKIPLAQNETKQVVVFVHGINNTVFDAQDATETLYKRLYWSGYNGRVAEFKWPCAYLPFRNTLNPLDYNLGEFYAWESASALSNYLTYLQDRPDLAGYDVDILAHSQGNVVASEAVRLGAPFANYVLTQGAIPAHCYDTSVPYLESLLAAETNSPTPFYPTNGGYNGYFSSVTGNLVNFYNTNDYALATGTFMGLQANWVANQITQKPEDYGYRGGQTYSYAPDTFITYASYSFDGYYVTNAYEIMSQVARSRTSAVGAQANVAGVIDSAASLDLVANFGFGNTRSEHSAEFSRPIQTSYGYYDALLTAFKLEHITR